MNDDLLIKNDALKVLQSNRVAIFIVAYNASNHIENVLNRIPSWVAEKLTEIYLIDDSSQDSTVETASSIDWPNHYTPLKIFKTPKNQGYGGNQKIGYSYAIQENFDIVVLLHGDGQYAPEALPLILAKYIDNQVDAVFGSRFLSAFGAIRGGMPIYKFIGNRVLTSIQNLVMGSCLSEWHSGYRSYRTRILGKIPFRNNSRDFDFDAEIIIQTLGSGGKIVEVGIPTFYGDEICHVNGLRYAIQCIKNVLQYRTMQFELFYDPRFDLNPMSAKEIKTPKQCTPTSLNYFMQNVNQVLNSKTLVLGENSLGILSQINIEVDSQFTTLVELNSQWSKQVRNPVDIVLALDVIEHVSNPEYFASQIHSSMKSNGVLFASTANVGFFPIRLMLLMGFFNYGRKGILDKTHRRLFTIGSFQRLLKQNGFKIIDLRGFGPPIASLKNGKSRIFNLIDKIAYCLAKHWPSLFAYQILITVAREDDLKSLTDLTFASSFSKVKLNLTNKD